MIKEIVRDQFFLSQSSDPATANDINDASDLIDTLYAHRDHCVGMAANMIGIRKQIIAFFDGEQLVTMLNPKIIKTSGGQYETEEGCLSLKGVRKVKRWQTIKVSYMDLAFKQKIKTYRGFTAQIIQHELDHCEGILI